MIPLFIMIGLGKQVQVLLICDKVWDLNVNYVLKWNTFPIFHFLAHDDIWNHIVIEQLIY